ARFARILNSERSEPKANARATSPGQLCKQRDVRPPSRSRRCSSAAPAVRATRGSRVRSPLRERAEATPVALTQRPDPGRRRAAVRRRAARAAQPWARAARREAPLEPREAEDLRAVAVRTCRTAARRRPTPAQAGRGPTETSSAPSAR